MNTQLTVGNRETTGLPSQLISSAYQLKTNPDGLSGYNIRFATSHPKFVSQLGRVRHTVVKIPSRAAETDAK